MSYPYHFTVNWCTIWCANHCPCLPQWHIRVFHPGKWKSEERLCKSKGALSRCEDAFRWLLKMCRPLEGPPFFSLETWRLVRLAQPACSMWFKDVLMRICIIIVWPFYLQHILQHSIGDIWYMDKKVNFAMERATGGNCVYIGLYRTQALDGTSILTFWYRNWTMLQFAWIVMVPWGGCGAWRGMLFDVVCCCLHPFAMPACRRQQIPWMHVAPSRTKKPWSDFPNSRPTNAHNMFYNAFLGFLNAFIKMKWQYQKPSLVRHRVLHQDLRCIQAEAHAKCEARDAETPKLDKLA